MQIIAPALVSAACVSYCHSGQKNWHKRLFAVTNEVCSIATVCLFLYGGAQLLFARHRTFPLAFAYARIVAVPLREECLFRGVTAAALSALQRLKKGGGHSEKEKRIRIALSAIFFASAHLWYRSHNRASWQMMLLRGTATLIAGALYSRLTEKYHSLAPGILAHGLHNAAMLYLASHPKLSFYLPHVPINLVIPAVWIAEKTFLYLA